MLRWGLILMVVPGLILMGTYMYEQSLVRACVEAGASFDYIDHFCDMNTTQPFISLMARQPLLVNGGMLLSSLGLLMCLFGLYVRPSR